MGWASDLNNTSLTFENGCLEFSLSVSQLSEGRLLEKISILCIEFVNYSLEEISVLYIEFENYS